MAISVTTPRKGVVEATLLDAVTGGTNNGEWIDVTGLKTIDVEVTGITTATVQVRYSNAATKPAAATHGLQLGSNVTADGVLSVIDLNPHWIKAMVSAWTSGTITARMRGKYR